MTCHVCGSEITLDRRVDNHTIRVCRDCDGLNKRLGIKELDDN